MPESPFPTLVEHVWPRTLSARAVRFVALAVIGTIVLTLSAKLQVPFFPVPMTLQTLAVLVIGAAFGARLAAALVALYLVEGALGLPVFAGPTAGPAYMAGPTGGYLAGFLVAAALVGWCMERGYHRSAWKLIATMTSAHLLIFVFGFAWLAVLVGPARAWLFGVEPFVLETIVKTALAAALVPALWKLATRLRA